MEQQYNEHNHSAATWHHNNTTASSGTIKNEAERGTLYSVDNRSNQTTGGVINNGTTAVGRTLMKLVQAMYQHHNLNGTTTTTKA
jgi:hypothetical protein